ncbi:DUF305 domain-containing protein [Nonomuraea sediminis]|uniref:DUF305 domain-containing protein n=1 Tax=Nonomuraea sediminis TaxID=2835864 RepID=UPI001BDC6362|nr:DUF305 domain-containing protein [Nonomuraea sediminis]
MTNRIMLTALAAGTLAVLTACGTTSHDMAAMPTATASAATSHDMSAMSSPSGSAVGYSDVDVMFAQMMIPHHEQAVEMADLAATRAQNKEIKDLAAKIKAAQDPEIQTMRGWLEAWGKPAPSGGMSHDMPGIMSKADMKKLESAKGAAFDRLFARLMIAHHNGAIDMARTEQAQGSNDQAKSLAKTIESAQQAEVTQMQSLLTRL